MSDSPIEDYLDELLRACTDLPPRQVRHLLAEAEAHLHDAADASVAQGDSRAEAETEAVRRFGSAPVLAQAERRTVRSLLVRFVTTGVLLGGIGAIAVGLSGLIAAAIGQVAGRTALVGMPAGAGLAPGDCARWLALRPGSPTCSAAALADWAQETVWYRIALGVLGVLAVAAVVWFAQRRGGLRGITLDPLVSDTIALTLFGGAALVLCGLSVDAAVTASGHGIGQWLSAVPIALVATVVYAVRVLRDLRRLIQRPSRLVRSGE